MEWNEKQKKAFGKVSEIYTELELTNEEVAQMHNIKNKDEVYTLFMFQLAKWEGAE